MAGARPRCFPNNDKPRRYANLSLILKFFRPFTPLLKGWLLSFAAWSAVSLVLGINFVTSTGRPWTQALHAAIRDQLPWVLLTPLIFRFAWRYPVDRSHWKRAFFHLLVCLGVVWGIHAWKLRVDPGPGPHRDAEMGMPEPAFAGQGLGPHRPPPPPPPRGGPGSGSPLEEEDNFGHPPPLARPFDRRAHIGPPPAAWDFFHFSSVEMPIYLMIISGAHTLLFYRRDQERSASLAQARLEGLKMQLQPHFLFNTLNTIAGLIHEDPKKADALLTSLSDLLRWTLDTSSQLLTPLEHELDFIDRYIAIMRARFEERLNYECEIEEAARHGLIPSHLLQPLVENAVRHGLEPVPEGGTVKVKAWVTGDRLHLSVCDNGAGLTTPTPLREGVGLTNTRARLREFYDDEATLKISNGTGVTVEITIPFVNKHEPARPRSG